MKERINGNLAGPLIFLFFLAIYLGWSKISWIVGNFLRGLAAIKG
jgi:hypothetical protein